MAAWNTGNPFWDEQIHQTKEARPGWNQQRWETAVELAAKDLIEDGPAGLFPWGIGLEARAEVIYREGI